MQKLVINIGWSWYFFIIYQLIAIGSVAIVFWLPFAVLFKAVLVAGIVGYLFLIFRTQTQMKVLELNTDQLDSMSILTTWVSILRIKPDKPGKIKSYVIFKDAVAPDQYREILIRARFFK